ncbi:MAG: ABC transporter permease [Propionibacteriaceae bacterium]|nr:ABC transporter permease [Propionibacteriaceae bacterium]
MSLAELAAQHGLHRVGARPPFRSYLKQTWERRDFIVTMAEYRLRATVEENRLGVVWLALQPLMNAIIYGTIFGLLQRETRGLEFAAHVVIGVFLFQFFSQSLSRGAKSITGNQSLVQSLAFPRLTLPLAEVIQNLLALMPSMLLLAIILPILGHPPTWQWLLMIPLLGVYTLFNAGVAMIAARLTVHVRDLTQLLPYISRLLFYSSGVLFNVDSVLSGHPWAVRLFDFHPIYQVLQLARGILMGNQIARQDYWLWFTGCALVTFVVGLLFFWAAEERYGRD